MSKGPIFTADQLCSFYDPAISQRDLIRHYTLQPSDLMHIRRCRGDHNRLGYALMLCYLRYLGRPLLEGEKPPQETIDFIAGQIDVLSNEIDQYLEQSRRRHSALLQSALNLRPFGTVPATELQRWLMPHAIEKDQLGHLGALIMAECRNRRIVLPHIGSLQRLCIRTRIEARREVYRRLTADLTGDHKYRLDQLTSLRGETTQTWLGWLRQFPESSKPTAMPALLQRLDHLKRLNIDVSVGGRVHQMRLVQIEKEGRRTTIQHIARLDPDRRHGTLVVICVDLRAQLTDQAIELFERLIGTMFRKAQGRHDREFRADGRAINEKLRLFVKVGKALAAAKDDGQDAFDAMDAVVPWDDFCKSLVEAEALLRPADFDAVQILDQQYAGIRRWAPAFLEAFSFEGVPAVAQLLKSIALLKSLNRSGRGGLPQDAPTGFIKRRWARYVWTDGILNRRHYELCVLSELRERLRAGDVWVVGSQTYKSFEERLISHEDLKTLTMTNALQINVTSDFDAFLKDRQALLNTRLDQVEAKAKGGELVDVSLDKGNLKISPIERSTNPQTDAMVSRLYSLLPRIRITDLLAEVNEWTNFTDAFTHLRSGEKPESPQIVMAALIADGLNLGLTRMAEACRIVSLGQLAWAADWHVRDETYALALQVLVNAQHSQPLGTSFGAGTSSSSDGQFFQATGFGRDSGRLNAHYGQKPGVKFYTHISDRYAPFYTKVIAATASEALHVLDALLYHQTEFTPARHHTDGGGVSDHVFALCSLLGFQFAPRIPDLKDRRLYAFEKPSTYPTLEGLITAKIDVELIQAHWTEILRVAASIRSGQVTASVIMRQLAAYPRQNGVATALREYGRLERTLFTLDWLEDPSLRRQTTQELNKGEARNSLARAVFLHRLGEIRDRTYENQQYRASGLNLLVTAIILWNTRYLEKAVKEVRAQGEIIDDALLAHLSPLGWEHINLTGDYIWHDAAEIAQRPDGTRELRVVRSRPRIIRSAA
ncbi:Tn3 family transposase ISAzs29 (plasmid) [Asticcacaulis sp. MM231]|uniref:Tn3 family transposase n=1 Tax=Asticcacaulis sp. MM231 TaxID=3157666 RepID=UPI0032D57E1B